MSLLTRTDSGSRVAADWPVGLSTFLPSEIDCSIETVARGILCCSFMSMAATSFDSLCIVVCCSKSIANFGFGYNLFRAALCLGALSSCGVVGSMSVVDCIESGTCNR